MKPGRKPIIAPRTILATLAKHNGDRAAVRRELGVNRKTLNEFIRRAKQRGVSILPDPRMPSNHGYQHHADPTPEEIAAACEEIRSYWSQADLDRAEGRRPAVVLAGSLCGRELVFRVREL